VATILPFLRNETVFEPEATAAMSAAFEAACDALQLPDGAAREREAVAVRIIELARRGERDPVRLSQSVLRDAGAANVIAKVPMPPRAAYDSNSRNLKR
jgi:hypothetical protein